MTVRFSGLIGLAVYLGIGSLFYAMFVGPHFDWTSAWTFGWLLAWPIMLFITFWVFVIGAAIIMTVVVVVWIWVEGRIERHRRRQRLNQRWPGLNRKS